MVLAEDEMFACNVVFMDRAARRVLGTSTAKVYDDFEKVRYMNLKLIYILIFYYHACYIKINKFSIGSQSKFS